MILVSNFTFHYVSISTIADLTSFLTTYDLHSTMYLFQRQPPEITAHRQPHLHSTMYLFKLLTYQDMMYLILIYIPLCIYLNFISIFSIDLCNIIYIPLCIYLNDVVMTLQLKEIHLHSTMYLFKPTVIPLHHICVFIYIPLCIYLNGCLDRCPLTSE